MERNKENVIEWISGQKVATVTFSQGKYKAKLEALSTEFPDIVEITDRNPDGSVVGHIPINTVSLNRLAIKNRGISPKNRKEKPIGESQDVQS